GRLATQAAAGHRVVLHASSDRPAGDELPEGLTPRGLVLIEDEIRDAAPETLEFFARQGVQLKVVSGDHPATVSAVARRAGVPGADGGLDARDLPLDDVDALGDTVASRTVFGRVTPRQKREMMRSLQARGPRWPAGRGCRPRTAGSRPGTSPAATSAPSAPPSSRAPCSGASRPARSAR